MADRDAEGHLERGDGVGQSAALADPCRPGDVRREVAVAESEPGRFAVLGESVHHRPRLVDQAPAALVIEAIGEHVHDGVVVGHHEQAVPLGVVAGVDDDRQVAGGEGRLEAVGELRATRPTGKGHDPHAVTRRGVRGRVPSGRSFRGRMARASGR